MHILFQKSIFVVFALVPPLLQTRPRERRAREIPGDPGDAEILISAWESDVSGLRDAFFCSRSIILLALPWPRHSCNAVPEDPELRLHEWRDQSKANKNRLLERKMHLKVGKPQIIKRKWVFPHSRDLPESSGISRNCVCMSGGTKAKPTKID